MKWNRNHIFGSSNADAHYIHLMYPDLDEHQKQQRFRFDELFTIVHSRSWTLNSFISSFPSHTMCISDVRTCRHSLFRYRKTYTHHTRLHSTAFAFLFSVWFGRVGCGESWSCSHNSLHWMMYLAIDIDTSEHMFVQMRQNVRGWYPFRYSIFTHIHSARTNARLVECGLWMAIDE